MSELDRGVGAVDPDPAHLVRREHGVHHRGERAAAEADQGGGDIFPLGVVDQARRHRPHLLPLPQQMQHQVELVDAVPHRRPAALGGPTPPPRHGVVRRVPVPGCLAVRDQRSAQLTAPDQFTRVGGAGAVAVLEDDGRVGARRLLGGRDVVVLGERQAQRLLAQHPGARLERGHRLLPVERRRGPDQHQVRPYGVEHRVHRGEPGDPLPGGCAEVVEPALVHVDGGDQFHAVGVVAQRGQMAPAHDGAGADDGDPTADG